MTQEEIKKHIAAILEHELTMNIATSYQDDPWSCIVQFIHDENLNLYWRSSSSALQTPFWSRIFLWALLKT